MPRVRLIGDDGVQYGVIPTQEARQIADEKGFDLVEVSPDAEPPVCRLIDYGKFKYEQRKKTQDARKKQHVVHIKEIRLRPITEEHDLQTKIKHAKEFLSKGDKVVLDMVFRGRQMAHKEIGKEIVDRVVKELEEFGKLEQRLSMQGQHMTVTIAPKELPVKRKPEKSEKAERPEKPAPAKPAAAPGTEAAVAAPPATVPVPAPAPTSTPSAPNVTPGVTASKEKTNAQG